MRRSLREHHAVDDYHYRLQRYPFDGRALIDEAMRVRPLADRERRLARRNQLNTAAGAALKYLILLRQPAKIPKSFVASPKFQQSIEPLEIVRVIDDWPAFPHRL
jgi:hypothetical protein